MPAWDPPLVAPTAALTTHTKRTLQTLQVRRLQCQLLALSVGSVFLSVPVQMIHVVLIREHEYDGGKKRLLGFFDFFF